MVADLKPGNVYLLKLNNGEPYSGILHCIVHGCAVFKGLPFASGPCGKDKLIILESIEWNVLVCPWNFYTTQSIYLDALSDISEK